jgi:hypothetical protein
MIIGVLDKSNNKTVYTYSHNRYKTFSEYMDTNFIQYEITEGTDEKAYSWNGNAVVFDENYTPFNPQNKHAKIYRYIGETNYRKYDAPIEHNYICGLSTTLFPKRTFVRGELQKVEWYADQACTDLVLEVDISYTRDSLGFALNRTTTRKWKNEDNTDNHKVKTTNKDYTINQLEQINEGIRRRDNIINGLQMPVLGMMIATKDQAASLTGKTDQEIILAGRDFLKSHKVSFQSFIDESHQQIQTDITNDASDWLNNLIDATTTIRAYVLNEINVWS